MNEVVPGHTTTNFSDKPNKCPACGYEQNAATSAFPGDYSPVPGALAICFRCGALAIYDENLRLRSMRLDELAEWKASDVWPVIESHSATIRKRKEQYDALPELGKRIADDIEKQWGWIRGPRPANAVKRKSKQKPRRHQ